MKQAEPVSSIDYQQRRGVAWDIIDEAIASFDGFMLDDDYDYKRALFAIMDRMRTRAAGCRAMAEKLRK